jgi:hypothetical protein
MPSTEPVLAGRICALVGVPDCTDRTAAALVIGAAMVLIVCPRLTLFLHGPHANARLAQAPPSTALTCPINRGRRCEQPYCAIRGFIQSRSRLPWGCSHRLASSPPLSQLATTLGTAGASGAISLVTLCAVGGRMMLGWWVGSGSLRKLAAANFIVHGRRRRTGFRHVARSS